MIKIDKLIPTFTEKIDNAVDAVAQDYAKRYIADEDDFTSQLLARIKSELNGWKYDKVIFRVRKITSKGPGSEERICGADIVMTVNIDLSNYKTNKGILIQAKILNSGTTFNNEKWKKFKDQIRRMKKHTLDSYVWLYDSSGVRSIRAHAIASLETRRPDDLYVTKCATFLGEFIQSKHGHPYITDENMAHIPKNMPPIPDEYWPNVISIFISDNDREHDRAS